MTYSKTIVCLANSRKMSGRCIAGKVCGAAAAGRWIRPVSERETEELSDDEYRCEDGTHPALLDIVWIPFKEPAPHACQTENHVVDTSARWRKMGAFHWKYLDKLVDHDAETLWANGCSSRGGVNDRVSTEEAAHLRGSLLFIKPQDLLISVATEEEAFGKKRRRLRAAFRYCDVQYSLRVPDPVFEETYFSKDDGAYAVPEAYICVSLGEPFEGFRYKLVAAIITPERAQGDP
ncbi:MAG: hypothetical protein NTU83_08920 [Candidatus Hydrogenedentes bacterium]|nr:hypothetical protein [Candidatus Hydrogenedentota bacterium]